jgi:hypothetical protein
VPIGPLFDLIEFGLGTRFVHTVPLRIFPVQDTFRKRLAILADERALAALADPAGNIRCALLAALSRLRLLVFWLLASVRTRLARLGSLVTASGPTRRRIDWGTVGAASERAIATALAVGPLAAVRIARRDTRLAGVEALGGRVVSSGDGRKARQRALLVGGEERGLLEAGPQRLF